MSIYKKQSEDPKIFDSPEEFLKYYDNNRKDIDSIHTRSLNLKYKINNHTIGRKQGKLILYPINKIENSNQESDSNINLESVVNDLNEKYEQLKQALIELNNRLKVIEQRYFQNNYHK